MLIERFQEAQAAVTDKVVIDRALMLADSALFPVKGCFYIYPDDTKQNPNEPLVSSDQAGILLAINDLFIREPERFGSKQNRAIVQQRCGDLFTAFEAKKKEILEHVFTERFTDLRRQKKQMIENLFSDIATIFQHQCPDALKGISIALVAMDSPDCLQDLIGTHRAVFTADNQKLLGLFDKVYDFYPDRNDGALTLDAIQTDYRNTCVDYVITGNVLNSPFARLHAQEIFLASACLLKSGGRAIHLVGYSSDNYEQHVANPDIIALAGQIPIAAMPMTFVKSGFEGDYDRSGCKDFIVFEQIHRIAPRLPARLQSLAILSGEQRFETLR